MRTVQEDDWYARQMNVLRPGWRGRLRIRESEEDASGTSRDVFGTVVEQAPVGSDPDGEPGDDTVITLRANYHDGRFIETGDEPRFSVYLSQVLDMQPM